MKSAQVKVHAKKSSSGGKKKVPFGLSAAPGSRVSVAGTFNNWDAAANPLKDNPDEGHFKTVISLPAGTYEYKFVVNGVWSADPACSEHVPDGCGSQNSVIRV